MSESLNTVFLSQVADGAMHLGLISESDLEIVFKLNCLFFDHVAIGASGLLCNKLLYGYLINESEAITSLYRRNDSNGSILQPVIWHKNNDSVSDLAEKMIEKGTIHYFESDEVLVDHARRIEEIGPNFLTSSEEVFRDRYKNNVTALVSHLLKAPSSIFLGTGLNATILDNTASWLSRRDSSNPLQCSDLYRFANDKFADHENMAIKKLADCAYHFSLASTLRTEFSAPQPVTPLVELMRYLSQGADEENEWAGPAFSKPEDISTKLPLKLILELPLGDVLLVRGLSSFAKVRGTLGRFRAGERISPMEVQDQFDICAEQLLEYASGNKFQRKNLMERIRSAKQKVVLRFMYDVITAASPIALALIYPTQIPLAMSTFVSAGLFVANQALSTNDTSPNTVYPYFNNNEGIIYRATDGTVTSLPDDLK